MRRNFGPKKASSPTTHENSESELEKVKRSLRKVSSASGQQHTSKKENVSDTVIRDSTNRKVDPIRDSDSGSTDQEQGKCWSVEDNSFGNNGAVTSQEKTSVNHRRARRVNAQYEDHSGSPDPEQVKDWSIEDYMNGDGGVLTSGGKPTVDCRRAKILNTKAEVYAGSPDLVQVKDGFVEDYINGNKGALSSDNKSSVEIKEARKVKVKTADYSGSADQKQVKDRSLESTQGEEEGMICISGALTSEEKPTIDHQRGSKRRASFPVRPEQVENGLQNTPVVPSYMASTQSAKAKFYGHASDGIEKASLIRRHSLPSGKLTSVSPRTQRAAQPSCKTGVRGEKNLFLSLELFLLLMPCVQCFVFVLFSFILVLSSIVDSLFDCVGFRSMWVLLLWQCNHLSVCVYNILSNGPSVIITLSASFYFILCLSLTLSL